MFDSRQEALSLLKKIISPVKTKEFFKFVMLLLQFYLSNWMLLRRKQMQKSTYWEQKVLLVRRQTHSYYKSWFSCKQFDHILKKVCLCTSWTCFRCWTFFKHWSTESSINSSLQPTLTSPRTSTTSRRITTRKAELMHPCMNSQLHLCTTIHYFNNCYFKRVWDHYQVATLVEELQKLIFEQGVIDQNIF